MPTQRSRLRIRLHRPAGAGRRRGGEENDEPALQRYLREIGSHATLSREEEAAVARRVQAHRRSRRELLLGIPFVADFVVRRAAWLRARERMVTTLTEVPREERGPEATAQVEAVLARLAALVDPAHRGREPASGRPGPSLARRIERTLRDLRPTDAVLEEAHAALRAQRDALAAAEAGEHRRLLAEVGLARDELERRLEALAREGEALLRAKNEFIEHNLKLVVKAASQFQGMGIPLVDLVQEANLGLMRAVEKFDPERANRFSTYAVWWIQQALIRTVQRQSRVVRLPSHVYDRLIRYDRARAALERDLGRDPRTDEMSDALELDEEATRTLEEVRQTPLSLCAPAFSEAASSVGDHLPDPQADTALEEVDRSSLQGRVRAMLPRLEPRERRILHWRFGLDDGEPKTLEQVGSRLGLSRERTRQIEAHGLSKLRDLAQARGLDGLL